MYEVMPLSRDVVEPKRSSVLQSTSKRVKMIFSVMASPNRIDILRILNSNGTLTYSDLKAHAGFRSKKESGKFAYHLRKLLRQSLVSLNKSEKHYALTNLGKLVLSLARQIEERSLVESGKMYVRSSRESIDEFNSHKIVQSLVREGNIPLDLAHKITEEAENKIYKYQIPYLTGSLIREIVNFVLLEHGYGEYRSKMARLGTPVYDIEESLANIGEIRAGTPDLLSRMGQKIFAEHLLTNTIPKDVADYHMSGDIHIANPGTWSLQPDTVFLSIRHMISDGIDLGSKHLGVPRLDTLKTSDEITTALSVMFSLLPHEASQEIVIEDLPAIIKKAKDATHLEQKLTNMLASSSATSTSAKPTIISFMLNLGGDAKIITSILDAYHNYVKLAPVPTFGLVINHGKASLSSVSERLADIISLGGRVTITTSPVSSRGIANPSRVAQSTSIKLESVSINLPRLAFESNKDETYFRARLALLLSPLFIAMDLRKRSMSDLTRRGLNPIMAKSSQYMQSNSTSMLINLVGIHEAVFDILGYSRDRTGYKVLYKIIETVVEITKKKSKDMGTEFQICMTADEGTTRFVSLDGEKYGKNNLLENVTSYGQGVVISAESMPDLVPRSEPVLHCTRLVKTLNGGLTTKIEIPEEASTGEIGTMIGTAAKLLPSFTPVVAIHVCGECGFKTRAPHQVCPHCQSTQVC